VTVVSQSLLATKLGREPQHTTDNTLLAGEEQLPVFTKPEELQQSEWIGDNPNMAGQGAALARAVVPDKDCQGANLIVLLS